MTKFANLEQQIRTEHHAAQYAGATKVVDLDWWASDNYRGQKVRALASANLVKNGRISTRNVLVIKAIMNQGFNGQVASVQTSDGRRFQLPLSALRATK